MLPIRLIVVLIEDINLLFRPEIVKNIRIANIIISNGFKFIMYNLQYQK